MEGPGFGLAITSTRQDIYPKQTAAGHNARGGLLFCLLSHISPEGINHTGSDGGRCVMPLAASNSGVDTSI